MNNLYFGSTRTEQGASALDSRALLSVKEGFGYGSTTEYVDLGDFEVDSISNTGAQSQRLGLQASSLLSRMDKVAPSLPIQFEAHKRERVTFFDPARISDFADPEGMAAVTGGNLEITSGAVGAAQVLYSNQVFSGDIEFIVRIKNSRLDSDGQMRIEWHCKDASGSSSDRYLLRLLPNDTMDLFSITNGSATQIAGPVAHISVGNVFYQIKVTHIGGKINVYRYTDATPTYVKYLEATSNNRASGMIGFSVNTTTPANVTTVEFMELIEVGQMQTKESVLKSTLALADIFDTNIQKDTYDFTGFFADTGSSWVSGASNNIFFHPGSGNTSMTYFNPTNRLVDGIFEIEMRGPSGLKGGLGIRDPLDKDYYMLWQFGNTASNVLMLNGTSIDSAADHFALQPNRWYTVKVAKDGQYLGWYIEDRLAAFTYAGSFTDDVPRNDILLAGAFTGSSRIEFRNPRVSILDDLVTTVTVPQNQSLSNTFNTYLPPGVAVNMTNNVVDFFRVGASRGEHMFGLSDDRTSSAEYDNNSGADRLRLSNEPIISDSYDTNSRRVYMADLAKGQIESDYDVDSPGEARILADTYMGLLDKQSESQSLQSTPRPTMEVGDKIALIDDFLGVSRTVTVRSFRRTYDADKGNFSQDTEVY